MNELGRVVVTQEIMKDWAPAVESFITKEVFDGLSSKQRQLLVGMAAKGANEAGLSANESMLALDGNNAQMAADVKNPTAGGHAGGLAQPGTSGSADRQFLVGICIALAAKTVGLELVQTINASSQNVTVDFLDAVYSGGKVDNAKNVNTYVVTVKFDVVPQLSKGTVYALATDKYFVLGKYIKPARSVKGGYIFELQSRFDATVSDADGAVTDAIQVAGIALSTGLQTAKIGTIDSGMTKITFLEVASNKVQISSVEQTKAIENYVPNQTTRGLNRTLTRSEADSGTDRAIELTLKNENYVIGNRTITGHIARLQYKRLVERNLNPSEFLTNAMKNEVSQEINYQILSAIRSLGVTNALKKQADGISFNAFFGPAGVAKKQFDTIAYATELVDKEGVSVAGKFADVPNTMSTMKYENIASLGTAIAMIIQQAAYSIGVNSRYGDADAVVVSSSIGGYLAASTLFTGASDRNVYIDSKTGAKLSGTIGDLKVYVDVQMPEDCPFVTVLRTNTNVDLSVAGVDDENVLVPGLVYAVKDIISSVELMPEGTGGKKIIMDSETEVFAVGDNPEAGYLTFAIDIALPGLQNKVYVPQP